MFTIPVVLFLFKRMKIIDIINKISVVKPKKIYLLADYGRNVEEKKECDLCRQAVEKAIDWDCKIIKNFATDNRGVYANIGLGAKWVFEREEKAIFLEDDNLPEISFFQFCEEMLEKYKDNDNILWICGTNYLGKTSLNNEVSYAFTHHMLPCGWASWGYKFNKYYDGNLIGCASKENIKLVKSHYYNKRVANQYEKSWMNEYKRIINKDKPISWDYQMDFSVKLNNLYGIVPNYNQIKNIGVDNCSIHGGNNFNKIMIKRFCGMNSYSLNFPLKHPEEIKIDKKFEKKINKIITVPYIVHFRSFVGKILRKIFKLNNTGDIKQQLKDRFRNKSK